MISLIIYILLNVVALTGILVWGFLLSTDEYPEGKYESIYFWLFVLATGVGNAVYWS